jgi:phosphoglycolate phosphatase
VRMVERYRHHYFTRDAALTLFPGTREMLADLRHRGHTLAIATGKSRAGLARALERSELREWFVATRCADQCAPKPSPDMLLELMEELGFAPDRTLMVGDTSHDMQMAVGACVAAVGVSYGAHTAALLAEYAPLALLDSPEALAQWLAENA